MVASSHSTASAPHERIAVRLRWRIAGLLLLVSVLPLALVGAGTWIVFGRLAIQQTMAQQHGDVRHHAAAIDRTLNDHLRALELIARGHSFEQLLGDGQLRHVFEALGRSYPNAFVDLGLIDDAGDHLAYAGPYNLRGKNYAAAEWFKTVRRRGTYVSDVFMGFRRVPHCVIAIRLHEGSRAWILRATINSDSFNALVRPGWVGATGEAFLINRQGLYQTPSRLGRVLERSSIADPRPHQGVREGRIAKGTPRIQTTTWLNDGRWMLVVQREEAEIRAPVDRAMILGAAVILLAMVLVVAATIFATWDLTARVERATVERDQLTRDLLRSAKLASLGEMASGLAHEINNPLAIICAEQTNIGDLLGDLTLPPQQLELRGQIEAAVKRCLRQVQRCSEITRRMLQFGQKSAGEERLTALAPVIEELGRVLRRQLGLENITLELDLRPGLPALMINTTELEQVLINLINNAKDAIERGGSIAVTARQEGQQVLIAVKDTGGGIAPEDLDRIFQPFFTTKSPGRGTGLGLSVCHGIVRGWGGTLEVRSEQGVGTEVTIRLPVPAQGARAGRMARPARRGVEA